MNDFHDTRVRTDDVASTDAWLRAQYGRVELRADHAAYAERAVGDATFSLHRMTWSARVDLAYESDRFYVISGSPGYAWTVGDDAGEFSLAPGILQPGDVLHAHVDNPELQVVSFDAEGMTRTARTLYGDEELEVSFAGVGPVSPRMRDYWNATLRWAQTQLPIMSEPLVRAHLHRTLAVAALEVFALRGDPRERRASAIEQAAIYTTAMTWIDEHASLPVTIDDAARAAGTSTAGLRRAFLANGQVTSTPEGYLELARLSAAHADLLAADPTVTAVSTIAQRWGFADAGAFSLAYLAAYGVTAATTLAR